MGMIVEYVQERGKRSKSYRYRRKVTSALKTALGKGEIVIPLGKTKAEALRNYGKVHQDAERMLAAAWDEVNGVVKPDEATPTARELYQRAINDMKELGFNPYQGEGDGDEGDLSWIARSVVAEQIAAKYERDPETDYPIGVSEKDTELVRALNSSTLPEAPEPTVEDAKRLYLEDRFAQGNPSPKERKKDEQRAERAVGHIKVALGDMPTIVSLKRADARTVLSHMRGVIKSPSTIDRYLNDVRAIISHGIKEFDLSGVVDPFKGLSASGGGEAEAARSKRNPFTAEQLKNTRSRILTMARHDDIKLIWRLLEGTGCRLSEITGLRLADAVTEGTTPHVNVEWHEDRRLKTEVSRRKVPLVGDALAAAQEAIGAAVKGGQLFPRYGREGGGDAASAALMKHVRAVVADPKVVVHSLRHNMKDRLRRAKVPKVEQDLILGHTMGGVGENYGGDEERLEMATEAMRKAFGVTS